MIILAWRTIVFDWVLHNFCMACLYTISKLECFVLFFRFDKISSKYYSNHLTIILLQGKPGPVGPPGLKGDIGLPVCV